MLFRSYTFTGEPHTVENRTTTTYIPTSYSDTALQLYTATSEILSGYAGAAAKTAETVSNIDNTHGPYNLMSENMAYTSGGYGHVVTSEKVAQGVMTSAIQLVTAAANPSLSVDWSTPEMQDNYTDAQRAHDSIL